jgi:hypothetical protein
MQMVADGALGGLGKHRETFGLCRNLIAPLKKILPAGLWARAVAASRSMERARTV